MHSSKSVANHPPDIIKGSLFALLAFLFMAVFGILTKLALETSDYIWVSFITYIFATLGTSIFILPQGLSVLKSQHYGLLVARATIGTLASFLYMVSMRYIPIVNSTLLFNTAPIFIPLLTVIALKVHVPKSIWYAVLVGFLGILVIIKPDKSLLTDPGNLIGLFAGISLAIAYLIMKILTNTEPGLRIIFYYFSIGTIMQLPLLMFTQQIPSLNTVLYTAACGIFLMLAQLGLIRAYRYATASQVGVYQYSSVVFVAIFQWLIWSQMPDLLDISGFVLVSIAGIYIISSSRNHK